MRKSAFAIDADYQAPFADAAAWLADMAVSNTDAAELVGVMPSTWSSYKAGANVPVTVTRLCRVMCADRAILSAHLRQRQVGRPNGDAASEKTSRISTSAGAHMWARFPPPDFPDFDFRSDFSRNELVVGSLTSA